MQREDFKNWLINDYKQGKGMDSGSAENRVSNAQKVENVFGDFDVLYDKGHLESIIEELKYSISETKELPKGIIINGDYVDGMATLRQAVRRYFEFKNFKSK